MAKAIFIAATGQNVGKTTLCLGLLAALHKRFNSIGFIKPIGQQHVRVEDDLQVDKDVVLFKEHFGLHADYAAMSPVILPSGFTRDFLDHKVKAEAIGESIRAAFSRISRDNEFTIVEGTGHVGVGSIIQMNNARVAAILGLEVVMIASGGLGSTFDELALHVAMCEKHGVKIRGIILNRVLEEKKAMIHEYFSKAIEQWNIPLIGCVPYNAFLNAPTLKDFETLFQTRLIAGEKDHYCHFQHPRLVAGSLQSYQAEEDPDGLIITPASREDIILATIHRKQRPSEKQTSCGMILTGRQPPSPRILGLIKQFDLPALYAPVCSYDAMKMITSLTAKIRKEDLPKIEQAISLVEQNINFDHLLKIVS